MNRILALALTVAVAIGPQHASFAASETTQADEAHRQRQQAAYEMLVQQNGGTNISPLLLGTLKKQLADAFRLDPDMVAMEREYPGLIEHVMNALVPIVARQVNATMPDLLQRQASYYAENMSSADIAAATAFYRHPTYPAIRNKTVSNVDMSKMLGDAVRDPDQEMEITTDDLSGMNADAASDSLSEYTAEERNLLLRFSRTAAGKKMDALEKGALDIEAKWSNESTPEEDKELEDAVLKAMSEFTGMDFSQ